MKKRMIAMILGIAMTIMPFASFAASSTESATSNDRAAAATLSTIGVLTGDGTGNYNLTETITRAQFAKMIIDCSAYKNLVTKGVEISLYKDVPKTNWAAGYIKVAVEKGLLSGYSDGNFRPDDYVTYEQAVNSTMKLLGYADTDFTGAFPYAQVNTAETIGLTDGIAKSTGMSMTKGDIVNLLYNALNTYVKDSTTARYAQQLGYSVNDSGIIDYADALSNSMTGPVTVKSSTWDTDLGLSTDGLTVYKSGTLATAAQVNTYDIVYYSKSMNTAWVYSDRVSGVYDKASPNQDAPTSIILSGTTYETEGNAAFAALSSTGSLRIGDTITLLLGKDGKIADAVSTTAQIGETMSLYVVATGEKSYTDSTGATNTSNYIKGVSANGNIYEYTIQETWVDVGDVVTLTFGTENGIKVQSASSSAKAVGIVAADYMTIGSAKVSSTASILDTKGGGYTLTSMSRLNEIDLSSGEVLYSKAENGIVTELILDDVTGDCAKYGVVTFSKSNSSDMQISGTYTFIINGTKESISTQNQAFSVKKGPAMFNYDDGQLESIQNLDTVSGTASEMTDSYAVVGGVTYPYASSVGVYKYDDTDYSYKASTITEMLKGKNVTFYYDKMPKDGGRIRVIVYK